MPGSSDEADKLRKQVSTLAEFGKSALHVEDVGALLQQATALVARNLRRMRIKRAATSQKTKGEDALDALRYPIMMLDPQREAAALLLRR